MELVRPCQMCPHMKRITLPKVLKALQDEEPEVFLSPEIAGRSRIPIQKMLDVS